jgi:hypothetical protein
VGKVKLAEIAYLLGQRDGLNNITLLVVTKQAVYGVVGIEPEKSIADEERREGVRGILGDVEGKGALRLLAACVYQHRPELPPRQVCTAVHSDMAASYPVAPAVLELHPVLGSDKPAQTLPVVEEVKLREVFDAVIVLAQNKKRIAPFWAFHSPKIRFFHKAVEYPRFGAGA